MEGGVGKVIVSESYNCLGGNFISANVNVKFAP